MERGVFQSYMNIGSVGSPTPPSDLVLRWKDSQDSEAVVLTGFSAGTLKQDQMSMGNLETPLPVQQENALNFSASVCDSTCENVCCGSTWETPRGFTKGWSRRHPLPSANQNSILAEGKQVCTINHTVPFRHSPFSLLGMGGGGSLPKSNFPDTSPGQPCEHAFPRITVLAL